MIVMNRLFTSNRLAVLSELFTNLAAGWYGTIFIYPGFVGSKHFSEVLPLLTVNIVSGTLSLLLAFRLKEESQSHD